MSIEKSIKKEPRYLFPGSNTCAGFAGFFEDIRQAAGRTVILKGGPGVGKSTLMREVGRRWEEQGFSVVYYRCSGDPDSLDAVFAAETGFLVLDGTAPHVIAPIYSGAAYTIVLSACWRLPLRHIPAAMCLRSALRCCEHRSVIRLLAGSDAWHRRRDAYEMRFVL